MSAQRVLIVGATGKQGGAAVSALLNSHNGPSIRALTRNTSSTSAEALKAKGVETVRGDLLDKASLVQALQGVNAAFLVTDPSGVGVEKEVKQGETFFAAAKEANVAHIIFTSVQSADTARSVPHFNSKYLIEEQLKQSGLNYTILRPVAFMDNIPFTGFARFGALSFFNSILGPRYPLPWIAVEDIGKIAAKILLSPASFNGQTIDLASESLNMDQITDSFQKATGSRPWKLRLPHFLVMAILPYDFKQMVRFWLAQNFSADNKSLRSRSSDLLTVEDWARKGTKSGKA